jgi:hypothetical protein
MKALVVNCMPKGSPDSSNTAALAKMVVDKVGVGAEILVIATDLAGAAIERHPAGAGADGRDGRRDR